MPAEELDGLRLLGLDCLEKAEFVQTSSIDAFKGGRIESVEKRRKALHDCSLLLLHRVTKVSLMANAKSQSEVQKACREISECTEWLLSFLKAFPISQGKTLFENLKLSLIDIYVDIAVLCNSFLDEKLDIPGKFSFPIATGMSWKSVKSLQDIPLTNANAVQISVLTQKALLEDLVCELDEYRQQAGSQDDGWKDLLEDNVYEEDETPMTSEELETVRQVQSVAKLCIVLFKKLDRILANSDDDVALQIASLSLDTPDLDTPGNKYECMDNLVPACANITRILDDVACQLQSPLPILEISTGIKEVTDEMKDICTSAAGIISDSERGWFDLMCTKIEQIKLSF